MVPVKLSGNEVSHSDFPDRLRLFHDNPTKKLLRKNSKSMWRPDIKKLVAKLKEMKIFIKSN